MKAKILIPIIIVAVILVTALIFLITALRVPTVNKTYEVQDAFTNINIDVPTSDIEFVISEDATVKVEVTETSDKYHTVEVINDELIVRCVDARNFFEKHFNPDKKYNVTIYMPASEYGNLTVKSSVGNVNVSKRLTSNGFTFNKIDINLGVGDIKLTNTIADDTITLSTSIGDTALENIKCKNLNVTLSTGDIKLIDTIADDTIALSASVGDIFINDSDAGTINIKTSVGDVIGTLLTSKIVSFETSETDDSSIHRVNLTGKTISAETSNANEDNENVPHSTSGEYVVYKSLTCYMKISIKE